MARKVGSVEIDIKGDSSGFRRELRLAEAGAKSSNSVIRAEFNRTGQEADKINKSIKSVGASLLALSVGAGLGLAASVNTLKNFGQAMSEVKAVSGATAVELAALEAEARRLGGTTRFSATEAATAIGLLARAGFTANEALVAVSGTLNLAQAGGLGLAESADIVANVLGGFNLKATQTARIVDVLALAANASNSSVQELGESLVYAAPTATALGLGVEETVAALGKLADAGLKGGAGGRGFQSFASAFVGKKDEITDIIGEFNLAEEGLTKLVRRLTEAGISTEQVIDIFRVENLDVFKILSNASVDAAKGLDPLTKKLKEAAGSAAVTSKIMDDNLNGAILGMQSALEELVLTFGEMFANGALVTAFTGLANLFRVAAENADILAVAAVALSIRGLIPLASAAIPAVITALRTMQLQIALVEGAAAKASVVMGFLGGPVTLLIAGAAAAFVALGRSTVTTDEAMGKFNGTLQKFVSTRDAIKADSAELITLNEQLATSIEAQATAAETTARVEISAISERIRKNKELQSVYESQLRADAALLRSSVSRERDRLAGRGAFGGDSLGLVGTFGNDTVSEADFEEAITRKLASIERVQKAGGKISADDNKVLQLIAKYREGQESLEGVLDTLRELNKVSNDGLGGDFRDILGVPVVKTETPDKLTPDQLAEIEAQKAVFETLQKTQALEIARIQGNTELVAQLERELELADLIAQYKELGKDATEAEALAAKYLEDRAKATADEKERAAAAAESEALARQRYDEFRLNKAEADAKTKEAEDAAEASREAFRRSFSDAVKDAITSGDVGSAIKEVFADNVTRGMKDALDDLADAIYNLFSDFFKSASGGSSGGGGIGGFLGGLVSGGIGALFGGGGGGGGLASALGIGGKGAGTNTPPRHGQTIINIAGDASEKTIAIMDQKLAQHRAALPSAIDSRVADRIKRGAY